MTWKRYDLRVSDLADTSEVLDSCLCISFMYFFQIGRHVRTDSVYMFCFLPGVLVIAIRPGFSPRVRRCEDMAN